MPTTLGAEVERAQRVLSNDCYKYQPENTAKPHPSLLVVQRIADCIKHNLLFVLKSPLVRWSDVLVAMQEVIFFLALDRI